MTAMPRRGFATRAATMRVASLVITVMAVLLLMVAEMKGRSNLGVLAVDVNDVDETGEGFCEEGQTCSANESDTTTTAAQEERVEEEQEEECRNEHENCEFWAMHGECDKNPRYMLTSCAKACKQCRKPSLLKRKRRKVPDSKGSSSASGKSPIEEEQDMLLDEIAKYGEAQRVEGSQALDTLAVVRRTVSYMRNFVFFDEESNRQPQTHRISEDTKALCQNRNELCAFWAAIGECDANPAFMVTNCAPSCRSCHLVDFNTRCPYDPKLQPDALGPGELNAMFERIVATAPGNLTANGQADQIDPTYDGPAYTVTVHSRPDPNNSPSAATPLSKKADMDEPVWVVTFDNFVTDEECDRMIQLGYNSKYERSKDVGALKFDGSFDGQESQGRTSENAWCSEKTNCRNDTTTMRIAQRISQVTGIPAQNSEDFQILKYEIGQFYNIHHDYIDHQRDRPCGPRILTFFLYLSDVDAGGGTAFRDLGNLTVVPKKGRALLWPSVLNSDPAGKEPRTRHEALPVHGGTKFAANAWIHLRDYITPQSKGCT